ncbi:MAG: type II secretion system protein [Alphaproteobacteria bacterium]|nr:type II secretion system protein [Alphaproteobacteria bacterium]
MMKPDNMSNIRRGFTLIEMSLVLVIIGLVIMIVFPALNAVRQSFQQSMTASNLSSLLRVTAAYVQANGCLPCPTPASTLGAGFGRVRGDTINAACGTCNVPEGIAPFASLGIPSSTAKDGWGRWITMRIDPALAINFGIIPPTAPNLTATTLCPQGQSCTGLCQANLSTADRIHVLTQSGSDQQAAVLFLSHGANGLGAYHADPLLNEGIDQHPTFRGVSTACSETGGFERCNANGDSDFVQGGFTPDASAPFDDSLLYLDRNALVAYLGNPACQSVW